MTMKLEGMIYNGSGCLHPLPKKRYCYVKSPERPDYEHCDYCTACERNFIKNKYFYCPNCPIKRRLRKGPVRTKKMEFTRY